MDLTWIGPLSTSLKTAADLTKTMVGIRDATMLQSKIIELQGVILSAQSSALSAQTTQFSLLDRVRELEKEMADLEAWNAEKEKYELEEVYPGTFAYALKKQAQASEPRHWLCATCYQDCKKSILNLMRVQRGAKIFRCGRCKNTIVVSDKTNVNSGAT